MRAARHCRHRRRRRSGWAGLWKRRRQAMARMAVVDAEGPPFAGVRADAGAQARAARRRRQMTCWLPRGWVPRAPLVIERPSPPGQAARAGSISGAPARRASDTAPGPDGLRCRAWLGAREVAWRALADLWQVMDGGRVATRHRGDLVGPQAGNGGRWRAACGVESGAGVAAARAAEDRRQARAARSESARG